MNSIFIKKYIYLAGIFLSMISCKKNETSAPTSLPAQEWTNVSYGKDSAQKIDIYLPADRDTSSTL